MIGIDWGTSSFRAFRIDDSGQVTARIETKTGIINVPDGRFAEALKAAIGPWLAAGETRVLMAGMIGSRNGWMETAYLPCPASAADLASALLPVPWQGAQIFILPGIAASDLSGTPEVSRGEETQIIGAGAEGIVCLPGSHSKWVRVRDGRILGFETYLTGEVFAAVRAGTVVGRIMDDAPPDHAAFDRGVGHSAKPGHLLHQLFGVRTLSLTGQLTAKSSASFLSGLLIGHEIRAALPQNDRVTLLGSATLCALYARAIAACGGTSVTGPEDCAAQGLARIGALTPWT